MVVKVVKVVVVGVIRRAWISSLLIYLLMLL